VTAATRPRRAQGQTAGATALGYGDATIKAPAVVAQAARRRITRLNVGALDDTNTVSGEARGTSFDLPVAVRH
jgi:hypothetical protein